MINPVITPPGMSVALFTQRIIAWLIDLLPFLYAASWFLDVPFGSAVRQLGAWGLGPRSDQHPPEADLVLWWSLGCGGHALYCLVMELLTGRTVGKVLARTVVLSEHGAPPRAAQVFVRNAFRVLELMPQFWVFGLLVMLSRNRQRLGDIFARTYVARRAPRLTMRIDLDAPKSPPDNADPGDSDSESNDDEAPRRGE
ncbi:MAG: RDD family protein [Planctomycetota bacterium]|nr:MAG: RDD family protein [Planctomycetota bacterium]